jgi:hypothetical protein
MVDETKVGSDWNEEELGIIVQDYFDMLAADLTRQSYSKSKHNAAVEARIGRSQPRGSVGAPAFEPFSVGSQPTGRRFLQPLTGSPTVCRKPPRRLTGGLFVCAPVRQ